MFNYLLPNAPLLERKKMANNFDPLVPANYLEWMDKLNQWLLTDNNDYDNIQAFDLMAVTHVSEPGKGSYEIIQDQSLQTGEIKDFFCANYYIDNKKILDLIMSENVNTADILLIEGQNQVSEGCSSTGSMEYEIIDDEPGYLHLAVDMSEDGWLYWSQTWYPGWKLILDGRDAGPPLKANFMFQAAAMPKGEHELEFIYQPFSFTAGAVISLITIGFIGLFSWRRKRNIN
jgi:hypothetical protein